MATYISPLSSPLLDAPFPRPLVLLGSTGSIGVNTLKVVAEHPGRFRVLGLAGARNVRLLAEQADRWRPDVLAVLDGERADALRALLPTGYAPQVLTGQDGYMAMARMQEARVVLAAQVGAAGLAPTLAAASAGKIVALANKESLVLAGDLFRKTCRESGAVVLPVDSEHNAVFQALAGHGSQRSADGDMGRNGPNASGLDMAGLTRIVLTASGGPFLGRDARFLSTVTREQALNHPNWSMGAKISIDSATLMNKGLEVIEACHLYGVGLDRIGVVVHPQSIVHSLVQYWDGSFLAHLGAPDMRIPIAYSLSYPERLPLSMQPLNLARAGTLTFEEPDLSSFPCLKLAMRALEKSPAHPVVLNAANEVAVERFLAGDIAFPDIPALIERALEEVPCIEVDRPNAADCLAAIQQQDSATRETVEEWIARS